MSNSSRPCTHDQRPGTTVCLRCRREERTAARQRRRRLAVRGFLLTVAGAFCLVVVAGLAVAIVSARPERLRGMAESAIYEIRARVATLTSRAAEAATDSASGPVVLTREDAGRLPVSTQPVPTAPPAPPLPPTPPLLPIVRQGATHLSDAVVAIRSGDSVTVHFDTPRARTRRAEKFEQIVRSTLPAVYGPMADSVLDHIPAGALARSGDLLTDLPTRGLHFSLGAGWALALWPETRPGLDGPLVVMYRAMVSRVD